MKPAHTLFITGLLLTLGAGGGVEFLPPDATWSQWATLLGLAVAGLLAMFVGANDIRNEYTDS